MRIEIHRTLMARSHLDPKGLRSVSYRFYVPPEDCPDENADPSILTRDGVPGNREVVDFTDATWIPDREPGWDRYAKRLAHEKACRALMLDWLREYCAEARDKGLEDRKDSVHVDVTALPGRALTEPVRFEWRPVVVPGSPSLINANLDLSEPARDRARRATCQARNSRYTVLDEAGQPFASLVNRPGRPISLLEAIDRAKTDTRDRHQPNRWNISVMTAWDVWRQFPGTGYETTAPTP